VSPVLKVQPVSVNTARRLPDILALHTGNRQLAIKIRSGYNMDPYFRKRSLNIRGKLYDLSDPLVMGIINYTPDSFYDGGKYNLPSAVADRVEGMIRDGVDIIDVGAVSSRPGAVNISESEEMDRLSEVMKIIREKFPDVLVSLDTFRAGVVRRINAEYRIDMINDISSGNLDHEMMETVSDLQVPYIAMHMQGTPLTMQQDPRYDNVVNEVLKYFAGRVSLMRNIGIKDIIIDPGFGFGKNTGHNYQLAGQLEVLCMLELPVLVGFSRKSMICKVLKVNPPDALTGTVVLNAIAIIKGAGIIRVHDVREARETLKITSMLKKVTGEKAIAIRSHNES
jgi:dihydropteroate synthase